MIKGFWTQGPNDQTFKHPFAWRAPLPCIIMNIKVLESTTVDETNPLNHHMVEGEHCNHQITTWTKRVATKGLEKVDCIMFFFSSIRQIQHLFLGVWFPVNGVWIVALGQ